MLVAMESGQRRTVGGWSASLLVGSNCGGGDGSACVGSSGRGSNRLGVNSRVLVRARVGFGGRGCVGLGRLCLRLVVGERNGTEWAAARSMADGRLSPALVLERNGSVVAKVLLELVALGGWCIVVERGAGVGESALTPGLSCVLVLSRAELASSLGLLLERLLLLGVGVADLNLELLGGGRDGTVVERLDDLFASVAVLEAAETRCQYCG